MAIVSLRIVDLRNCMSKDAALAHDLLEAAEEAGNNSRKERENNPNGSQVVG
jgi:hypothetical protein